MKKGTCKSQADKKQSLPKRPVSVPMVKGHIKTGRAAEGR